MRLWESFLVVVVLANLAHAQAVHLTEAPLVDSHCRVELTMELAGKVTVRQDKAVSFKQTAQGRHEFVERVLEAKDGLGLKAARFYQSAEATIKVEDEVMQRKLDPRHALTLVVRKRADEKSQAISGKGNFTREALDLTEHFDTLAVTGLVPGKEVKAGETWSVTKPVAQALGSFDALIKHELTCKLKEVKGDIAHVEVVGTIQGIDLGAEVSLLIDGSYEFDLKEKRLTRLVWKQTEQRKAGPVNPEMAGTVTITLRRTPLAPANEVNDFALVPVQGKAVQHLPLVYRDPRGRFEFQHGRDWILTSPADNAQVVLRLLDRGNFVAQATFTPLKKGIPGQVKKLDDFEGEMADTPGWEPDKILERKANAGHPQQYTVHRVTAAGRQLGVECIQSFLLITSPQGDQLIAAFSMPPNQAGNVNGRDDEVVRSVVFSGK